MKISKTAIFLFELMIVILIFSLAAAICTSVFGKAYGFSEDSKALTMAVLRAESIAEEFKAGKTLAEIQAINLPEDADSDSGNPYIAMTAENAVFIAYDGEWDPVRLEGKPVYGLVAFTTGEGNMQGLDIWVAKLNDRSMNEMLSSTVKINPIPDDMIAVIMGRMPIEEDELIYRLKVKSYVEK